MKKYKNDIIFALVLLILSGGALLFIRLTRNAGAVAVVSADGEELYRLPLDEDAAVTVGSGGNYNIVTVSGGYVSVTEASCPDKICVNQGKIRYDGEMIVCLPNKLIVTVYSGEKAPVDATS